MSIEFVFHLTQHQPKNLYSNHSEFSRVTSVAKAEGLLSK